MLRKFVFLFSILFVVSGCTVENEQTVSRETVSHAQKIPGLQFTRSEIDSLLDELNYNKSLYDSLRTVLIKNSVAPALGFNPLPESTSLPQGKSIPFPQFIKKSDKQDDIEKLAFYSIRELAYLLKTHQVTSVELTKMFIDRLKKHDQKLHCVITITEELAMEQAQKADREISSGQYRGLLHGIPYGAKDLLAVKGYKTTWGAVPYKDQVIDETATVIKKLEEAGAVLVAKLTLGALAWGDVWFGEKTRNPWNLEQGSSGSSAGSASATAAGLVPFAIGSETWGSIVSPSTRCGTSGLRPTFGAVSRAGAMALSWSMDKLGPIARSVDDCAIVFNTIRGADGIDADAVTVPFNYDPGVEIKNLKIGYLKSAFEEENDDSEFDKQTLENLKNMGVELIPVELPNYPIEALSFILSAEAAAAFDDLTRSNQDDLLVRQIKNAWPNVFRAARFIPAVEYIQANRVRKMMINEFAKTMEKIDVYVAPSFGGDNLLFTNLSGHPAVVLPNGFRKDGTPVSISFTGKLYEEGVLLAVANRYQQYTDFHLKHPEIFIAK